ncbi:ABC transporter ATP-binding protein, partial [Dietzia sp.]|uniref:ABC transporter ATP-binding protein n=1 Tax=Dietzia sp. TaxID=1871616 RepID=UPI002FD9293F
MTGITLPVAGYREAFGYLGAPLRRRAGWVAVVVVAGIVAAMAGLAGPWVIGQLVDELGDLGDLGDISDVRAGSSTDVVWEGAAVVAVAAIVLFAATWVGRLALARVVEPAIADLREDVMARALQIESAEIERAGTGDLVSRVADDSRKIGESASQILPSFVESLFVVAISAVGLAALDLRLGLVGLVAIPMYWLTLAWYLPRAEPRYTAERAAIGRRAGRLLGGLEGRATLRAYRRQDAELRRIHESSRHARDLSIGVFRFLTRAIGRNNRAEAVVLSLIIVAGFVLVGSGQLTAGAVTTAALVFHRLFNPIGALVGLFDQVMSAGASLTRMVGVILLPVPETAPESDPEAKPEASPGLGILALDAVRFAYPGNAPVLHGIDLDVPSGHVVAVVGSTGSGKTTMA